jgi:D-alanyl-lipoteichoic acid acyltransferase DltB (MBOAT superfamily)
MPYTSASYLIFFLGLVWLCYTITPKKFKWIVLLLASYIFYFLSSRKLIVFLLMTTLTVYATGLILNRIQDSFDAVKGTLSKEEKKELKKAVQRRKKWAVAAVVIINFGCLAFIKYYNFVGGEMNRLLVGGSFSFPHFKLLLPLGISFYTLQSIGYVVDVYRGKYRGEKNPGKIALFLSFFPCIVEGPIGRYDLLGEQLYEGHSFNYENVMFSLQLILWGLFKKIVIADRANAMVSKVFDNHASYSGIVIITVTLLYTLQLYADFSGCMDIASGSAQLFGVGISKNFERPFFSRSVNEFWRRWHITLGAWLRDYIFYPVSLSACFMKLSRWCQKHMNRFLGSVVPAMFSLLFVWMGNGIWHGAGWKYAAYGMYYYAITIAGMLCEPLFNKFLTISHINREGKFWRTFQLVRTFILVNIGMLLFRADNLRVFADMFRSIFSGFTLSPIMDGSIFTLGVDGHDFIILAVSAVILLLVGILQEKGHGIRKELASKNIVFRWAVYYALIMFIVIYGAYGTGYNAAGFIYAQF